MIKLNCNKKKLVRIVTEVLPVSLVERGGGEQRDAALVEGVRLLARGHGQAHREQQLGARAVEVHRQRQRRARAARLRAAVHREALDNSRTLTIQIWTGSIAQHWVVLE